MWNSIDSPFYTRIIRNRINCWVVSVIFNLAKNSLINSTHNETVRRPSIRPSVNFFLLSHLIRVQWSDFFETCPSCSPSGLVVSARIWFRFVDKYGRRWPTLIFTVIASPPKPLEEFRQNLAYEFLSVSDVSA